ncbi:MAG TPA: two-component system response regulator [Dokdonella sp.]|nr:two-component system response regulator [Dokdonella sp.]HUD43336.1 two-component system response regulator [Dokdonella sp.]
MNVLIVDDQPSARTMLRHVVEAIGPGIRVSDFGSPVDALRWSDANPADLLLLDYRMPEMDGLEFARRFRRPMARRDVPIVLISVVGDEPIRQAALDAGVIDFMVKPIRPRELRSRCKNLLQLRRQGESVKERARSLEQRVLQSLSEVEQRERETLFRLAKAIEYRDFGTGIHLLRMAHYSELLAEELGMPEEDARILTLAAPLHDIGKIGVPDAILLKRGSLTEEEMAVMRKHPLIGYEILKDSQSRFVQMGALIALRHHERWDGSGYPDGLKGEAIPLPARIVALADVYDALTSERPYKAAWSSEEAFDYIKAHRGTLFDPSCVDVLLAHRSRIVDIQQSKLAPHSLGL